MASFSPIGLFFRGLAMGVADLVPGVSGGTVAFISGIYETLLDTIKGFPRRLPLLWQKGPLVFWKEANFTFLTFLLSGVLAALLLFTRLLTYLLEHHAAWVWAFFFGLILASIYMVVKTIKKWNIMVVLSFVVGTLLGYGITVLHPIQFPQTYLFVFLSGVIAICAMILPGISGSFILLLLGMYHFILHAVKDLKISIIVVFAAGCLTGILSFSHVVSWCFKKAPALVTALLAGFMLGSVNKVWPYKETISQIEVKPGKFVPLLETNVLPEAFTLHEVMTLWMAVGGVVVMLVLDKFVLKASSGK